MRTRHREPKRRLGTSSLHQGAFNLIKPLYIYTCASYLLVASSSSYSHSRYVPDVWCMFIYTRNMYIYIYMRIKANLYLIRCIIIYTYWKNYNCCMWDDRVQSGRRQGKLRARPAYRGKWKTIFQNRKAKRSQVGKQTVCQVRSGQWVSYVAMYTPSDVLWSVRLFNSNAEWRQTGSYRLFSRDHNWRQRSEGHGDIDYVCPHNAPHIQSGQLTI